MTEFRSARHSCAYQLGDVLPQLDVHSLIGKTELLEAVCTPGMAPALGLRIRLAAQVSEAPLIVWRNKGICHRPEMVYVTCAEDTLLFLSQIDLKT